MLLEDYQKKRDFSQTPEPQGKIIPRENKKPIFVVHEHQASRLHWDLRLENNGVLKSWAIPKGIPQKINEKKLAVQVEDHPLEYKDFEGEIPKGQYGAGKVKIWDSGTFETVKWDNSVIEIVMHGGKMRGRYTLVKTREYTKNSWLLIKQRTKGD